MTDDSASDVAIFINKAVNPVALSNGTPFPSEAVVTILRNAPPGVQLGFEVHDGKPVVVQVLFGAGPTPDGGPPPPVSAAVIRSFPLERITEQAVRALATSLWFNDALRTEGGLELTSEAIYSNMGLRPGADDPLKRVGDGATSVLRRRRVTDALLTETANIVRANPDEPTKAVAREMFTSHRNATRWIAAARDRGLLIDGFSETEA